jgi:hypothetical protein
VLRLPANSKRRVEYREQPFTYGNPNVGRTTKLSLTWRIPGVTSAATRAAFRSASESTVPQSSIPAGQLQPTGGRVDVGSRTEGGRALAIIDIKDDLSGYQIPLGAAAQVAIYNEYWHHLSLLRKILLRMRSWENYVFLEGH